MAKAKYGLNTRYWSKPLRSKITSIEAYIGCAGFSLKTVARTTHEFFAALKYIYGVETPADATFDSRVFSAHNFIKNLSRDRRQELQKRSRDRLAKIGFERFAKEAKSFVAETAESRKAVTKKAEKVVAEISPRAKFYKSWEWRTLRMSVLKEHGLVCMCCGAEKGDMTMAGEPVKICVDHIKPLATHWHLRLERSNLQVLCDECNQGKGAWDTTDWRAIEAIEAQLRYSI